MPVTVLADAPLALNGDRLLTPTLRETANNEYQVVLEGTLQCRYNDTTFDALYLCDTAGAADTTRPHNYLQWSPSPPTLEQADPLRHRYVFRIPAAWKLDGQSAGIRLNIDQFVNELLIPPSEVRNSLSGVLTMTVLQTPLAPVSPWPMLGWSALPAALVLGGVGLVIRRRMTLGGLDQDLQTRIGRIEQKVRANRASIQQEDGRILPLNERLNSLRDGAVTLARQVQQVRHTLNTQNRAALNMDIKTLQNRLAAMSDEVTKRECCLTLSEKHKALTLLDEMCRAEERCLLRLDKIEAVLDSTLLGLRSARADTVMPPSEQAVCRALDAEVAAIREVSREIASYRITDTTNIQQNLTGH